MRELQDVVIRFRAIRATACSSRARSFRHFGAVGKRHLDLPRLPLPKSGAPQGTVVAFLASRSISATTAS